MTIPGKGLNALRILFIRTGSAVPAPVKTSVASAAQVETQSRVSAELVKGKLNPVKCSCSFNRVRIAQQVRSAEAPKATG